LSLAYLVGIGMIIHKSLFWWRLLCSWQEM